MTLNSGGAATSAEATGRLASGSRVQVVLVFAGSKVMVSRSRSASWIWYKVEIRPSSSVIFSAKREQLTQLGEEVSGAIGSRQRGWGAEVRKEASTRLTM